VERADEPRALVQQAAGPLDLEGEEPPERLAGPGRAELRLGNPEALEVLRGR